MPKIRYVGRVFSPGSLERIEHANSIIEEYRGQGFVLTLRQLYYQFVSRDLIPNTVREYKRLGSVINDARLAAAAQPGKGDVRRIAAAHISLPGVSQWLSEALLHFFTSRTAYTSRLLKKVAGRWPDVVNALGGKR